MIKTCESSLPFYENKSRGTGITPEEVRSEKNEDFPGLNQWPGKSHVEIRFQQECIIRFLRFNQWRKKRESLCGSNWLSAPPT